MALTLSRMYRKPLTLHCLIRSSFLIAIERKMSGTARSTRAFLTSLDRIWLVTGLVKWEELKLPHSATHYLISHPYSPAGLTSNLPWLERITMLFEMERSDLHHQQHHAGLILESILDVGEQKGDVGLYPGLVLDVCWRWKFVLFIIVFLFKVPFGGRPSIWPSSPDIRMGLGLIRYFEQAPMKRLEGSRIFFFGGGGEAQNPLYLTM